MTRLNPSSLPRLLAFAGWFCARVVADALSGQARVSPTTFPRLHGGLWCLGDLLGDGEARGLYLLDGDDIRTLTAHQIDREGPVVFARTWLGAVTDDEVTVLRASREVTGIEREAVLAIVEGADDSE